MTYLKTFLHDCTLKRKWLDYYLDPKKPRWAKFDSQLGYIPSDSMQKDGIGETWSIYRYEKTGERKIINYPERKCRINTYGNSFTQCHQVSDGQTWQEILAAQYGEPIRNFGVGGQGLYQAYLRMLREEKKNPSEYILLNIFNDDHYRSIDRWRWIRIDFFRDRFKKNLKYDFFHANPWAYLSLDDNGGFTENDNPYPTGNSLYSLTDADHVYDSFKKDPIVHLYLAQKKAAGVDRDILADLALKLDVTVDLKDKDKITPSAEKIHKEYAIRSSIYVLEKLKGYARRQDKKIMILLSYGEASVRESIEKGTRFDESFLDYLKVFGLPFIDSLEVHRSDFKDHNLDVDGYIKKYYIGHYNPLGNFFFASCIRDKVADWLDPKPVTYREESLNIKEMVGYLA